ncbi:MAG TPA: hypothetical protein VM261_39180 [Kofleriaceae bacterium]|nr:hypothetical protein [Kofleriaceae bacterium]
MPRTGRIAFSGAVLLLAAGTAHARPVPPDDYVERPIVIAGDMPQPPPPPLPEPEPVRDPPRRATIGFAAGGLSYASDTMTALEHFGRQGTLGIVHVPHREEPGFELLGAATGGARGRSYSLAVRLVLSPRVNRTTLARPFLALGPSFAIARLDDASSDKGTGAGMGIGPSAAIGLHGFVSHRVYWRASAGFVGAGIGTFSTDLGLGWVIDK